MVTINKRNILSLVAAAVLAVSTLLRPGGFEGQALAAAQPAPITAGNYSKQQTIDLINNIAADAPYVPEKLAKLLEQINQKGANESFEENLIKAIKTLLAVKVTPEQRTELNTLLELLDKKLQGFKASGPAFAADFNGAFFIDNQNPRFTVSYKDRISLVRGGTLTPVADAA